MSSVDRFLIRQELIQGTWSTIYRAFDDSTGKDVVLKVYRSPQAPPARRALGVMRTLAAHGHPGLPLIHLIDDEGRAAMEWIGGGTLGDRWRACGGSGLDAEETGRLATGLLETLAFVHALGVVHGDLSARNILLRRPGEPVLVDFVGWAPGDGDPPGGTPAYLAPERWTGGIPSAAGDLFSVGALLWESVTGARLRTRAVLENRGINREAKLESGTPAMRALVTALIATDPGERPSAQEGLRRLQWP